MALTRQEKRDLTRKLFTLIKLGAAQARGVNMREVSHAEIASGLFMWMGNDAISQTADVPKVSRYLSGQHGVKTVEELWAYAGRAKAIGWLVLPMAPAVPGQSVRQRFRAEQLHEQEVMQMCGLLRVTDVNLLARIAEAQTNFEQARKDALKALERLAAACVDTETHRTVHWVLEPEYEHALDDSGHGATEVIPAEWVKWDGSPVTKEVLEKIRNTRLEIEPAFAPLLPATPKQRRKAQGKTGTKLAQSTVKLAGAEEIGRPRKSTENKGIQVH